MVAEYNEYMYHAFTKKDKIGLSTHFQEYILRS